ncbi:MAG: 3-deoxy-7-phosphoheptulonate synthase [Tissierellia bacterium]|nr:3-deoxy-7-phosphoheptulonate synthase [Tissierellia bacterium]
MMLILKKGLGQAEKEALVQRFKGLGYGARLSRKEGQALLVLDRPASSLDLKKLGAPAWLEDLVVQEDPPKKVSWAWKGEPSQIDLGGRKIGGGHFQVIAGPCSVESRDQIVAIGQAVKASGAGLLRGGAYKPRTSPYSFQGLGQEGLDFLMEAKKKTGLPLVAEIMDYRDLDKFEGVDLLQVGARNMQNYGLLKALGKVKKPILLKRGFANTYEEWLMSAEYIMAGGNEEVILCERGIRTFETHTRNTLDLTSIPVLREMTHLPIIVDPSHGTGKASLVEPMALAAAACGADGLMIEVHNDPEKALSDGDQALDPQAFDRLMDKIKSLRACMEGWV